jgi:catechol 2,3-dioxygenase-like lactoylglutathione lyase family enzyme
VNLNQVTVPVRDVEASAAFYRKLGLTPIVQKFPEYARFECPDGGATFSLHRSEEPPRDPGVVVYFECVDVDVEVERLRAKGLAIEQEARDQPWLWREAYLLDPDGNRICVYHAGTNRRFPPWRLAVDDPLEEG